jgi:hypothetical protein
VNYLRTFLLEQSEEVYNNFISKVLKNFWNGYHLFVWKTKKNFASFQGNELALFVGSIRSITEYLNSCIVSIPQLQDICAGLELWQSIFKFLTISYIEEGDAHGYKNRLEDFNAQVEEFYSIGIRTFLTRPGKPVGSDEPFYSHALWF